MKAYSDFAQLLENHLVSLDRSPSWLAHRLGLNTSTVSRWLNEYSRPKSPEIVIKIADILHIDSLDARNELLGAAGYLFNLSASETVRTKPAGLTTPPFMVPPLPTHGIMGRGESLERIKNLLKIGDKDTTNVPPVALQGMGGIGKTTLAMAFGHSEYLQNHFPDGVLWTSVGPAPTIRLLLDSWGKMLGIDLLPEPDEDACSERLRSVLHYRRVLLIVDDVWEIEHGRYFNVAGPKCRTLFTTRETPIAYGLAGRERTVRVDILNPEDALTLLQTLVPEAVINDRKSSMQLCERLEFLPLAITLAGRLLANEADVPSRMKRLLDELIERKDSRLNLVLNESRPGLEERTPSIEAILGMSAERLSQIDKERFAMLAVFGGEPLTWDINAAAAVWDCSKREAEETIAHFIQRGLVTIRKDDGRYWMHTLLTSYAEEMMTEMGL